MAVRDDDDDEPRPKKKGSFSEKPMAGKKRRRDDDDDDDDADIEKAAPQKSNTLWYVLSGVGLAAVFGCCCLPGGLGGYWWYSTKVTAEERQKKVDSEPGIAVTAEEITLAYQENIPAADAKYKDKVLIVKGNVMSPPNVDSLTLRPGVPPGRITIGGVNCTFSDKHKGDLLTMKQGDNVTIKGYCTGTGALNPTILVQCKKVN